MNTKKSKPSSEAERFRRWLEEGSATLDMEMEADLQTDGDSALAPEYDDQAAVLERDGLWERLAKLPPQKARPLHVALSVAVCVLLTALLLACVLRMPRFGDADTLENSELTAYYALHALEDVATVDFVTSIVLNYRGFDTLGESHVLFCAVCTVLILLRVESDRSGSLTRAQQEAESNDRRFEPRNDNILQCAARVLVPFALMLGAYVVINGHLGPGGGFAGGAIMGAGLMLYLMAFGYARTERFFTERTFRVLSFAALCFYTLSKGFHFITGAAGVETFIRPGVPGTLLSGGLMMPLNIAVGTVVACTMYTLYTLFRKGDF